MSSKLGDVPFASILPEAIRDDVQIRAAADALDGFLRRTTDAIPNLLLFARLDREKAVCLPPLQRLVDAAGGLNPLSTELLELLAWQFHVDFREVATNDAMLERMVRESIPWHRIKGTPAAVEQALAMYDVQALVDETGRGDKWAVYELELAAVPYGSTLAHIQRVAEEAAPTRCWLRRVYGGYNGRPMRNDQGPKLDSAIFDDDSGVWDPGTGIKQSFGQRFGIYSATKQTGSCQLASEAVQGLRARYIRGFIHDQYRFDSVTRKRHGIVGGALVSLMSIGLGGEKHRWEGEWNRRRWNEASLLVPYHIPWTGQWDHRRWVGAAAPMTQPIPRRRIDTHSSISKAQIVWDATRHDAGLQKYGPSYTVRVTRSPRMDSSRLDGSRQGMGAGIQRIDEFTRALHILKASFSTACFISLPGYVRSGTAQRSETCSGVSVMTFKEEITGLYALRRPHSLPDGTEWCGAWTHRIWRTMGVVVNLTTDGSREI